MSAPLRVKFEALQKTGKPIFAEFIRSERLKEAKKELTESNAPLKSVSEALGWSNEYNFIRFFKDTEGIPPGQFRKIIMNREQRTP